MLDAKMLLQCHAHVPVWFWPVLWVYLARLKAAMALAKLEGRKGFMWHVEPNGVIWISHMDASAAERAARGELPRGFDRTPWTRLAPLDFSEFAGLGLALTLCTGIAPSPHRGRTLTAPLFPAGVPLLHPP